VSENEKKANLVPEWVLQLIGFTKKVIPPEFVGKVEVNAFKGGVSNVNVTQSYKEDTTK